MAVLTTVSWGASAAATATTNVVAQKDEESRNFPARFGSQHPGAVLHR